MTGRKKLCTFVYCKHFKVPKTLDGTVETIGNKCTITIKNIVYMTRNFNSDRMTTQRDLK